MKVSDERPDISCLPVLIGVFDILDELSQARVPFGGVPFVSRVGIGSWLQLHVGMGKKEFTHQRVKGETIHTTSSAQNQYSSRPVDDVPGSHHVSTNTKKITGCAGVPSSDFRWKIPKMVPMVALTSILDEPSNGSIHTI